MRTTLALDDDVLEAAKSLAASDGRSLGRVISDLARRGLEPRKRTARDRGFPVVKISQSARPLTSEMVRRALDED